jgi:hypothetical protein
VKTSVSGNITPCSPVLSPPSFQRHVQLHFQGRRIRMQGTNTFFEPYMDHYQTMFFNFPNPLSCTRPSVCSRNEYQKQKKKMFLASKARPVRKANNLTAICEPIALTISDPQYLITLTLHGLLRR